MNVKLSPQMLGVLRGLADPQPDSDPFPPVNTLAALARRKLIRFVEIKKPRGAFELLMGRQVSRIQVTRAGKAAAADATPTPSNPPAQGADDAGGR